jgi:5-hydroxyisourate hydrolase
MPGLSVHVVDVTRGVPAQGMAVAIHALSPARRLLAEGLLSASGVLDDAITSETLPVGVYEVVFQAGAFFAAAGVTQSDPPFLDEVPFRFSVADPRQHLHLPLKITPWGFSIYRGA